jgi:two-component system, NarL family, sensor kinase
MDSQETALYTAIVIACFIVGVVIVYFIVSLLRQQRRNLELSRRNILAEITAMEKERSRIANDLHDDLGPLLSVIKFQVDTANGASPDDDQLLYEASTQLDSLIDRLRAISSNLTPASLARKGLVASLERFVQNLQYIHKIAIRFTHDALPPIHEDRSINIYRIVQEVVNNTLKHARATQVTIHLEAAEGLLRLHCTDNGTGFDYEESLRKSNGLGLLSLKSRADLMKGKMKVESRSGIGTAYLFEIPIY